MEDTNSKETQKKTNPKEPSPKDETSDKDKASQGEDTSQKNEEGEDGSVNTGKPDKSNEAELEAIIKQKKAAETEAIRLKRVNKHIAEVGKEPSKLVALYSTDPEIANSVSEQLWGKNAKDMVDTMLSQDSEYDVSDEDKTEYKIRQIYQKERTREKLLDTLESYKKDGSNAMKSDMDEAFVIYQNLPNEKQNIETFKKQLNLIKLAHTGETKGAKKALLEKAVQEQAAVSIGGIVSEVSKKKLPSLSEDEKFVAKKFGISEEKYATAKMRMAAEQ